MTARTPWWQVIQDLREGSTYHVDADRLAELTQRWDTVIGLDPNTQTGWSVLNRAGELLGYGAWDLSTVRGEGYGFRFVRAGSYMLKLLGASPWAVVGFELVIRHARAGQSGQNTQAAQTYGGVIAQLLGACEVSRTPYVGFQPGTIKKCATGSGNASKGDMLEAARRRWPQLALDDQLTDDMADAIWTAETTRLRLLECR